MIRVRLRSAAGTFCHFGYGKPSLPVLYMRSSVSYLYSYRGKFNINLIELP
jgi:hypothetical protein